MEHVIKLFQKMIWVLFLIIIGYLLIASVFSTCYFGTIQYTTMSGEIEQNSQHTFYIRDNYLVHILLWVVFSALLMVAGNKKWGTNQRKYIIGTAIGVSVLGAVYIVLAGQYYPRFDQRAVIEAATNFLQGDYSALEPGGHIFLWPYQFGIVAFYCILSFLFGSGNIVAFQLVNVLLIILSYILLAKIGKLLCGGSENIEAGVFVTAALFVPYLFYSTLLYGNVVGFLFACLACYCVISFDKQYKWYFMAVGSISITLAIILKPNCEIFMIALVIYLFGVALADLNKNRKSVKGFLYVLLMIGCCLMGKLGCNWFMLYLNKGKEVTGVPMVAFIAMGLQDCKSAPGWWGGYTVNIYSKNQWDYKMTSQVAREDILRIIRGYPKNITASISFFIKKIASQWNNPTYNSLWLISGQGGGNGLDWLLNGKMVKSIYIHFVNLIQTWILAGSFLYALFRCKKGRWEEILLPLIFIGGFIFHIFWEAQNMYAVPYILLLLPLCVCGYREWRLYLLDYKTHRKQLAGAMICILLMCTVSRTEVFAKTFARIDDVGIFDPYEQNVVDQDKLGEIN